MIKQDFLLRTLEEMGKLLAEVNLLKDDGYYDQALQSITTAAKNILKTDTTTAFSDFQQHSIPQQTILAQLLEAEGDIYSKNKEIQKAKAQYTKALAVQNHLHQISGVFSFDRVQSIKQLESRLKGL